MRGSEVWSAVCISRGSQSICRAQSSIIYCFIIQRLRVHSIHRSLKVGLDIEHIGEMSWTRGELTAVYWKHISRMPRSPEFVQRSAGGSTTTSWNGYSATYRTGAFHALANESIFSRHVHPDNCSCPIEEHSWTMALIGLCTECFWSCRRKRYSMCESGLLFEVWSES